MKFRHMSIIAIFIFIVTSVLFTGEMVGIISDEIIKPPNLNSFNPPSGAGSSYTDPVFGTRITRITDNSHWSKFVLGGYMGNSEICYFNKDGSYFIAEENEMIDGRIQIATYLYDGNTGERLKMIGRQVTSLSPYYIRWALADRYKKNGSYVKFDPIYHFYHYASNEIRLYDVRDLSSYQVVKKFTEYGGIGPGGGEGDISLNGRYWLLDGGNRELFVYDLVDDIKYKPSTFSLGSLGSKGGNVGVDYGAVSPSGKYAVVAWGTEPGLNKRYAGIELYDRDFNYIRHVHPSIVHWTIGFDAFGDEVVYTIVTHDYPEFFSQIDAQPGDIVSVRLSDGKQRLLKHIPSWAHMALSACNTVTDGKYIYAAYHNRSDDPNRSWAPFWDEVIEIPTDGSGKVRRFAHHRSHYVPGHSMKYYQPDAVINRQGTKIVYRSTYNHGVGDLYMFDVGTRSIDESDVLAANPPVNLRIGLTTFNSIEMFWDRPPSAEDGDFPSYYKVFRDGEFIANVYETSFTDEGLEAEHTYEYKVYSVDDATNISDGFASATLSTEVDVIPPVLESVRLQDTQHIELRFSEQLDVTSAENSANYSVNNGISILNASLVDDSIKVLLQTTPMQLGVTYTLTVNGVTDVSSQKNVIETNTRYTFSLLAGFFDDFEDGIDDAWVFKTENRWEQSEVPGNHVLLLNTSDHGDVSNKLLGEYAIVSGSEQWGHEFRINVEAKSTENIPSNIYADYAVVFGFVDEKNYYYLQFQSEEIKLHRLVDGTRTVYEGFPVRLELDDLNKITVELESVRLRVLVNDSQMVEHELREEIEGKLGVGSYNDSAWFDNVNIGSLQQDDVPPAPPSGLEIISDDS